MHCIGSDSFKKNSIFIFIFNCVLFDKLERSFDDVAFVKFDKNPNFVLDDILLDVVVCLRNQGNSSPRRMDFIHDKIVDSLMEQ